MEEFVVDFVVFTFLLISLVYGLAALISGKYKVKGGQIRGARARYIGIFILSPFIIYICLGGIGIEEKLAKVILGILLVSTLIASGIYGSLKKK